MQVHPAIAALRSNPALQRRTQARVETALKNWRSDPYVTIIAQQLAHFAAGAPLQKCDVLSALVGEYRLAERFVAGFCSHGIAGLRKDSLGEIPLRHASNPGFARLQLMQHDGASLSLIVYEPMVAEHEPATASFTDSDTHEMVIAGSGEGLFHTCITGTGHPPQLTSSSRNWKAGSTINCTLQRDARQVVSVSESLLILRLRRSPPKPLPTRDHRLCDGVMIRQASGDKRASQQVMALAVLGALDHQKALGPMHRFALDRNHDADARWEAVRQSLSIDARRGMALLAALAADGTDGTDQLSGYARDLERHLIATQPELIDADKEMV